MCRNVAFSASHRKVIQFKRAFLGDSLEPKSKPCYQNNNSVNENKIFYLQIAKTASIDLGICQGEHQKQIDKQISRQESFLPNTHNFLVFFIVFEWSSGQNFGKCS